jgi:molybdate transport system ATP-binding protein
VLTITTVGSRVRVGLAGPQAFSAEITEPAARALGLRPGARVTATWKAAATRLLQL